MPFSNTPSDLKTVITCIRLCVYERHRREFKRLFKSILGQYQGAFRDFCSNVPRWQHRDVDPVGKRRHRREQVPCFLFSQSQFAHFQRRIVERAWAKARQHVIFLQHRIFALLRGLQLNFISVSSMPPPNAKYLVQTDWLGISTAESANFLSIEGVT